MRKLLVSLFTGLAAILLLSSCSTNQESFKYQKFGNDFNVYLENIKTEYTVVDTLCESGKYLFVDYEGETYILTCQAMYRIIANDYDSIPKTTIYLAYFKQLDQYYYMADQRKVINDKGELVESIDYFKGK